VSRVVRTLAASDKEKVDDRYPSLQRGQCQIQDGIARARVNVERVCGFRLAGPL